MGTTDGLVSKFADNTIISEVTDNEEVCRRIRWEIDQLKKWAKKCEVLYFGKLNVNGKYTVNRKTLTVLVY